MFAVAATARRAEAYESLARSLRSGLPLTTALHLVTHCGRMTEAMATCATGIEKGMSFTEALAWAGRGEVPRRRAATAPGGRGSWSTARATDPPVVAARAARRAQAPDGRRADLPLDSDQRLDPRGGSSARRAGAGHLSRLRTAEASLTLGRHPCRSGLHAPRGALGAGPTKATRHGRSVSPDRESRPSTGGSRVRPCRLDRHRCRAAVGAESGARRTGGGLVAADCRRHSNRP